MGARASAPLRQFPKTAATDQLVNASKPKETTSAPPVEVPKVHPPEQEIREEEMSQEEREQLEADENEMRQYLTSLNNISNSITEAPVTQRFAPEGVQFVKGYREEKEQYQRILQEDREEQRKYKHRLEKDKLELLFNLHRDDPNKWTPEALGEHFEQDPDIVRHVMNNYSPLMHNLNLKPRYKTRE